MLQKSEDIKSKLVKKYVRNVRRGYEDEESARGMFREGIKMDLGRTRLLTESYKETDGLSMVMRRAKALENILTKKVTEEPQCSRAWVMLASLHEQTDGLQAAVKTLERRLEHSPNSLIILVNLGIAKARIGKFSQGEQHLLKAAAITPQEAGIWATLARLALSQGETAKARQYARKALKIDPTIPEVREILEQTDDE